MPAATILKDAVFPFATVTDVGCTRIAGFTPETVSLAALDVLVPAAFLTTQWKSRPFLAAFASIDTVAELLAKLVLCQVFPPSDEYCHW